MDMKSILSNAQHVEHSDQSAQEQLALQGEALEALEKTYGIWQSVKANKVSLLFSTFNLPSTQANLLTEP